MMINSKSLFARLADLSCPLCLCIQYSSVLFFFFLLLDRNGFDIYILSASHCLALFNFVQIRMLTKCST